MARNSLGSSIGQQAPVVDGDHPVGMGPEGHGDLVGIPFLQKPGVHHLPDPVRPELPDGAGLVRHGGIHRDAAPRISLGM